MSIQAKVFTTWSNWHNDYQQDEPFKAVMINNLYRPVQYTNDKKVFIHGIGYKPFGKGKQIKVPSINDQTNLNEYLDLYGKDCLFFGLTRRLINNNDCSWTRMQLDFSAMLAFGIDKWIVYVDRVNKLKEIVNSFYIEKYGIIADNEKLQTTKRNTIVFRRNLFMVSVRHNIGFFIRTYPHLDPIEDDTRLFNTFKYCEALKNNEKDLSFDRSIFPESVEDRLKYLFDAEVAKEYENLMHYFSEKDLVV